MRFLFVLLMAFALTGCQNLKVMICGTEPIPPQRIQIDPRALTECHPLVPLAKDKSVSFEDVLANHANNATNYNDCKEKQKASIDIIRKRVIGE